MNELQQNIIKWAEDKGIFEKSDPTSQFLKTIEELGELASAVNKNDLPEIKDAIGDVTVTLILLAEMKDDAIDLDDEIIWGFSNIKTAVVVLTTYLFKAFRSSEYDDAIQILNTMANHYGWTLQECLQSAYDVISKRTGKMENGVFVKDRQ